MYKSIIRLRSILLVFLTHKMALPILKLIRSPEKFPYTRTDLHLMPAGTLGNQLIRMLDEKQLELLPYYAKHDIKHLLLEYDTTDEGEVCLQCFMLGNRHISFPVVATVIFGAVTMPEYWVRFREAFHRGRSCKPISRWDWFTLLDHLLEELIEKVNAPISQVPKTNA